MKKNHRLQAVFFDLDGTLLYTLPDIARVVNYGLKKNGLPALPVGDFRDIVGWGLKATIRKAVPEEMGDPAFLLQVYSDMKAEYERHPVIETVPYPGIPEMLRYFQEHRIPMGILSNKDHGLTGQVVKSAFPEFTFIGVYGHSPDVPHKPDPSGFFMLMKKAACRAEQIMFVGDTATDMETARAAGSYPLGVSWGYRTSEELLKAGADSIVDHPREIPDRFLELSLDRSRNPLV